SSDAGISIGAAVGAHFKLTGEIPHSIVKNDFLGHPYREKDVELALSQFREYLIVADLDLEKLAGQILNGEIIGWYQGGSEFGPRALGNRSILADARTKSIWTRINKEIKFREEFRPLAPIVPMEYASTFFETNREHPFMLEIVKVKKKWRNELEAI